MSHTHALLCICTFVIFQPGNDPYAFVEFAEHQAAAAALMAMNKRMCLGRVSVVGCLLYVYIDHM